MDQACLPQASGCLVPLFHQCGDELERSHHFVTYVASQETAPLNAPLHPERHAAFSNFVQAPGVDLPTSIVDADGLNFGVVTSFEQELTSSAASVPHRPRQRPFNSRQKIRPCVRCRGFKKSVYLFIG